MAQITHITMLWWRENPGIGNTSGAGSNGSASSNRGNSNGWSWSNKPHKMMASTVMVLTILHFMGTIIQSLNLVGIVEIEVIMVMDRVLRLER